MNDFGGGRLTTRPWNYYPSPDIPVQFANPPHVQMQGYRYSHWRNFGPATSISAISFGFIATAIFISMFLIMVIIEHLFRPRNDPPHSPLPSRNNAVHTGSSLDSGSSAKSRNHHNMVRSTYVRDYPVVMPGQKYPTCIAQPAPLLSCPREGFHWQPHHPSFAC